jgi:serine/threonine-protein kinase RsbW
MKTCSGCHVELTIPNRPEFVAVARVTVAAVAARMEFDMDTIADLRLVVAEACTNAIEYGCGAEDVTQLVTIRCELDTEGLTIIVSDAGVGFDPAKKKQQPRDDDNLRGLGMVLIEALMDEVEFTSAPGCGTRVRMRKNLRVLEKR